MQGFAVKIFFISIALFTLLNSAAFSNNVKLNTSAGCMQCHQSETLTDNETINKNSDIQLSHKNQKHHSLQKIG